MAVNLKNIEVTNTTKEKKKKTNSLTAILSMEIGGQNLNDSFRESLYSELALLLEAGLNVKTALDLIASQQKKEKHQKLLQKIIDELIEGARLSETLQNQKKFSAYEYYSIKIGEETGNLIEVLQQLASFYSQKIQQRRSLTSALTYPVVILITAVLAVTFMLTYMVPLFKDIFLRMGGELPWITKQIINLSQSFGTFINILLLLIIALIATHFIYRKREAYKKLMGSITLNIPIAGKMILTTHTLRLIQSMSLLTSSKVPLTEALELSQRMMKFYPIKNSLEEIRKMIMQGQSLNYGLSKFKIYDPRLVALVRVGEESNQLDLIFKKLSAQMEEELQHRAKMLGNVLEPLIIIFLGFLVAVILIAMYLPMFQLSTSIGA